MAETTAIQWADAAARARAAGRRFERCSVTVIGIDPGPTVCGIAMLVNDWLGARTEATHDAREWLREVLDSGLGGDIIAIEQVRSYGMAVGAEVFDTIHECGRLHEIAERAGARVELVPRIDVKMHLCHNSRAKDANIRAALIDRYGGSRAAAIGRKKTPGPLYGVKGHEWAALAIACYVRDTCAAAVSA